MAANQWSAFAPQAPPPMTPGSKFDIPGVRGHFWPGRRCHSNSGARWQTGCVMAFCTAGQKQGYRLSAPPPLKKSHLLVVDVKMILQGVTWFLLKFLVRFQHHMALQDCVTPFCGCADGWWSRVLTRTKCLRFFFFFFKHVKLGTDSYTLETGRGMRTHTRTSTHRQRERAQFGWHRRYWLLSTWNIPLKNHWSSQLGGIKWWWEPTRC